MSLSMTMVVGHFFNFQMLLRTTTIGIFQMQLGLDVLLAGNHSLHMSKLKHH